MMKPLKILMLEDSPEDSELVTRALQKGNVTFTSYRVDTREAFISSLQDFEPDVILSDHSLPQFDSTEALQICQRAELQLPFILVTGTVSEEFAVSCLKDGVDDYILKGNLSRLPSAIDSALKKKDEDKKRRTTETAMRQQNEELIKISKELDQFVYNVSHNLRGPLMSVLGLLNLARADLDEKETSRFPDYFRMMDENVNKLDETLNEIIDYSKNSRIDILNEKINVVQLLEGCFGRLKYLQGAATFVSKIRAVDAESIFSDPYRLSVVFTNLISNAIKYRDFGKSQSFVHIDFDTNGSRTTIRVEDNGIGIDPKYLPHIFDMFYRATNKSQGAGLGLYIAKQMIENLGGHISVESTPDVGTTFTIDIPSSQDRQTGSSSAAIKLHQLLQGKQEQEHEQGLERMD